MCSRAESGLDEHLIVILENAEMIIRQTEISRMTDADRNRVSLCQDWFSDPHFQEGKDSVIMVAESRSLVNTRIAQLPQVLSKSGATRKSSPNLLRGSPPMPCNKCSRARSTATRSCNRTPF